MRRVLALILALALASPACAQIYPGYGTPTLLGDGSVTAPSYSFSGSPATGFYRDSVTGRTAYGAASTKSMEFASGGLILSNAGGIYFNSTLEPVLTRNGLNTLSVSAGGSTAFANIGGVLFLEANSVANSGSLSQTLHTYTLPANTLAGLTGKTLRVTTMFSTANNANAKAVQVVICGSLVASLNTTASIAGSIRIETLITRTGTNTQSAQMTAVEGINSATLTQAKQSATYNIALACTETAGITINAAVNTAALSDASSSFHMVELLN